MRLLTRSQVISELNKQCREAGSVAAWAKVHGFTAEYVYGTLSGSRPGWVGVGLLKALGMKRAERYTLKEENDE